LHRQRYVDHETRGRGMIDGYMTLATAAKASGLTVNNMRQQIRNGVLASQKFGSMHFVTEKDLTTYIKKHRGNVGRPRKKRPDA
jgi:hypothetical protein